MNPSDGIAVHAFRMEAITRPQTSWCRSVQSVASLDLRQEEEGRLQEQGSEDDPSFVQPLPEANAPSSITSIRHSLLSIVNYSSSESCICSSPVSSRC